MTQESEDQKKDAALPATVSLTAFSHAVEAANSSLKVVGKDIAPQLAHSAKQLATSTPFEIMARAAESRTAFSAAALAANSSLKMLGMESSAARLLREFASDNPLQKSFGIDRSLLDSINGSLALTHLADMQPAFLKFQDEFNRPAIDAATLETMSTFAKGIDLAELQLNRESTLQWISELERNAIAYDERFHLPAATQVSTLFTDHHSAFSVIAERHRESMAEIERSLSSMNSRWLDSMRAFESSAALAALHGIGHSIGTSHPFADEISEALRIDLGNWRDSLVLPDGIAEDINLRTNFYVARGYNPDLANFPEAAFREGLGVSRLDADMPDLVGEYGLDDSSEDSEEEINFARVNRAHDRLFRFETRLRQFIDAVLTAEVGEHWPRQRVPEQIFENWKAKKQKAEEDPDAPKYPFIAYADFTDYVPIITRKDNWQMFAPFFRRPDSVRESMQRLYPVRLCTMHARFIQNDDELYLYAEVTRLTKAISRKKS